jgi:hypothetical protein
LLSVRRIHFSACLFFTQFDGLPSFAAFYIVQPYRQTTRRQIMTTDSVRVLCWTGEDDLQVREIRGLDADAVRDRALSIKNAIPVDEGPYLFREFRCIETGEWVAVVRVRGQVMQ